MKGNIFTIPSTWTANDFKLGLMAQGQIKYEMENSYTLPTTHPSALQHQSRCWANEARSTHGEARGEAQN